MTRMLAVILVLSLSLQLAVVAVPVARAVAAPTAPTVPYEEGSRIAVTSDGDEHDEDDWGATPATLSILAAAGLQEKLVHYDINAHLWEHLPTDSKDSTGWHDEMRDSLYNAAYFFGYGNPDVFFDDQTQYEESVAHLAAEIEKSTADNKLYIILGGPAEVLYQACQKATKGHAYVTILSHSIWNNQNQANQHPGECHKLSDIKNVNVVQIKDQNQDGKTPIFSTQVGDKYDEWKWMQNAENPGLKYVYQRMKDYRPDISDCGMIYYLLTNDENGSPEKLKAWFQAQTPNFLNADLRLDQSADVNKMVSELPELKQTVYSGVEKEDLALPDTVKAVLGDNQTTKQLQVTWECETYDPNTPGTYWFYGTLTMPEDGSVVNPAHRQPVLQVTQVVSETSANVTGVETIEETHVAIGTAQESLGLPSQIVVTLSDGTTKALPVTWSCDSYRADTMGRYTFTGTINLPSQGNITNLEHIVAYATVIVEERTDSTIPGVFMEYFGSYDRRTDYTCTPAAPAPGNSEAVTEGALQGHAGIPDQVPVSWSEVAGQINGYWGKNGPEIQYDGHAVVDSDYFAVRWTANLTTPDYTGAYYFKINANDGKRFAIYDTAGELLGEYTRWNSTKGVVNTGANHVDGAGDSCTGFTVIDAKADVVKVYLQADTAYRIEMEFCEHKDTAFGKLQWLYQTNDSDALKKLGGSNASGTAHEQYLVPADRLSLPDQWVGSLVQGYVYDTQGRPLSGITATLGENSYTTDSNGYYRLLTHLTDTQVVKFQGPNLTGSVDVVIEGDTVVAPVTLREEQQQQGVLLSYYHDYNSQLDMEHGPTFQEVKTGVPLSFSWSTGSPVPGVVGTDKSAVVMEAQLKITQAGTYRFMVDARDGGTFAIDGEEICSQTTSGLWQEGPVEKYLTEGFHHIRLMVFDEVTNYFAHVRMLMPGETFQGNIRDEAPIPAHMLYVPHGLEGQAFVCGTVTTAAGEAVEGASVQLYQLNGQEQAGYTAYTGQDGSYRILVDKGTYSHLTAAKEGFSSGSYQGEISVDGDVTGADVVLEPQGVAPTEIASVTELHGSAVVFGTPKDQLPLYQSVQVRRGDGTVVYVPVKEWVCEDYHANQAGTYSFVGLLDTSNAYIIEDSMATTPCSVSNPEGLTAILPITVMEQGRKPLVWIISDMSDNTLKGSESTGTVNDPDDISAMAGYFLMANEFETRGIVISSTHRKEHVAGTPDQKEWADRYFGEAYAHDLDHLNGTIGGYPDTIPFYQSCIKETADHFDPNKSYKDLSQYDTVQMLVDEVQSLQDGEILNILCWGSLTEQAIFVKHCLDTGKEELLEHVRFIAHWTNSSLKQGSPEQPWKVANFNEDASAGWYVKDLAFEGVYDYFELGCCGQHGIVSGQPRTNGYYDGFKESQLGTIFAEGKFVYNGVDHSDSATYWVLLGGYGVDLGDVDPRGNNAAKVEQANIDAFYKNSKALHEELLRRAQAAAKEVTATITFAPGEGTGEMASVEVAVGQDYILPSCTFTPPQGQQFKAWSVNGSQKAPGTTLTVTEDVTLVALWESKPALPSTLPGLQAYYYSNTTMEVNGDYSKLKPVASEIVQGNLNFSWGSSAPHPDLMTTDYFSVVYQGYITVPKSGTYEFKTTSNDGGLLKIDGKQVTLKTGGGGSVTGKITLDAGTHTFYLCVHEVANTASIKVEWKKPGDSSRSVVPGSVLSCDPLPVATEKHVAEEALFLQCRSMPV